MLVALLSALLIALFAGTAGMMEWRIEAVQSQLADRLEMYKREVDQMNRRMDRLEDRSR